MDTTEIQNKLQILFDKFYWCDITVDELLTIEKLDNIWETFQYDVHRYFIGRIDADMIFGRVELIGILLYRIARGFYLDGNEKEATHYSHLGRVVAGFEIYYSASIGKGLKINHGLGTVIGARCIIGDNALIHQCVTLGDRNGKRPTLLNNVTVYAGAKILGGVICGNNSTIAANSVCLIDVPNDSVLIGIPGKIK